MRCGRLRLNLQSRRVFLGEQEVEFKNKEYELLRFLMENPEIAFTREYLYETIWGFDAEGDSRTVSVHINRLRSKIDSDPDLPEYIQTVWGVGYRFKP